ncbi:MAG: tetratricopeptide repeat protein, partial [Polyangiaceae bacterium]|nr:tetratricopeptide repeat protein [Polyangiaceae bacterium]
MSAAGRPPRRWAAAAAAALALAAAGDASGDGEATTRALRLRFAEGRALEAAGRWADALARFEAIARARPTPGVRFHVALCHDRLGRLRLAA